MDNLIHRSGSGDFGAAMAARYGKLRHGWDGRLLLDRRIFRYLDRVARPGRIGGDPGGGAGWISVYAAKKGARMRCSDINPKFVADAEQAVRDGGVADLVEVRQADIRQLPYEDASLDFIVLSNVVCAVEHLDFFGEIGRVMKPEADIFVSGPDSLESVFTVENGGTAGSERIIEEFGAGLARVRTLDELTTLALEEKRIHRATIRWKEPTATLVRGFVLEDGDPIFRLISGPMLVPNFWHEAQTYRDALKAAGIVRIKEFADTLDDARREKLNAGQPFEKTLGPEYFKPAFRVWTGKKRRKRVVA